MSEIIVKLTDSRIKLKGGEYVRDLVRCKDCKWKQGSECVSFSDVRPFPDDFCSRAEREQNG